MRKAALLAATLALAGCGGGDDGGDRLSADEYRTQANAICAEANEDLRDLEPPDSLESMRDFVDEAEPIAEDATVKLEDLEPPEDLEATHERWIAQNRRMITLLEELTDAQNLPSAATKAREFDQVSKETNELAQNELGLDACGES